MNAAVNHTHKNEAGFSLVETVIAMGILATGLLSLAGVFSLGMLHLAGSSANLIAREKAREAVESVHTARDTKTITWCQIYNVASARPDPSCATAPVGVFLADAQPLRKSGVDGLVNTADDEVAGLEEQLGPGADNELGTADDVHMPLTNYTRQIAISEILTNGVYNATLRRIVVTVTYQVGTTQRSYSLTTYISSIS
jgi:pilin/secretion family protein with methylation motif